MAWQAAQCLSVNTSRPRVLLRASQPAAAGAICALAPALERGGVFGNDEQRHMGVLQAAELGALAAVHGPA